jgi:hypothetical protein
MSGTSAGVCGLPSPVTGHYSQLSCVALASIISVMTRDFVQVFSLCSLDCLQKEREARKAALEAKIKHARANILVRTGIIIMDNRESLSHTGCAYLSLSASYNLDKHDAHQLHLSYKTR